jgi:hypothetical protein
MAARTSLFVQNSGSGTIDVEEARLGFGALLAGPGNAISGAKSGFRPSSAYSTQGSVLATGTPDGFVHVQPFQLFLQGGRSSNPGTYTCSLDAIFDINVLAVPADPTNPRNDLIIAQQPDTFYGDGNSDFIVTIVRGTPAGSPVDPTVTGSQDYVALARVRVNANATTITNANITDLRTSGHAKSLPSGGMHNVALGGILPVESLSVRNALPGTGAYPGFTIFRRDTKAIEIWDDANGWLSYDTVWQTYTPAWTSSGTAPVLNNGSVVGRYMRQGKNCITGTRIIMGSTSSFGTGAYFLSLPFTAAGTQIYIGTSYIKDASAGFFLGECFIDTSASVMSLYQATAQVGQLFPMTWAVSDYMVHTVTYETV